MKEYESREFRQIEYKEEIKEINFTDCEFYNCTINEIEIRNCNFRSCKFYNCTVLNVKFKFTDMLDCEFYKCLLIGVNWTDLAQKFSVTKPFTKVEACELRYHIFERFNLKAFSFKECSLEGSIFEDCNLEGASFEGCNLKETQFKNNNMNKADFRDAKDFAINIYENKVKNAKFSYPEAISLLTEIGIKLS